MERRRGRDVDAVYATPTVLLGPHRQSRTPLLYTTPTMKYPLVCLLAAALIAVVCAHGDHSDARSVSSFSFTHPFFPEAGMAAVPGWEIRGGTAVTTDYIRLTPDIVNRNGYVISRRPCYLRSLEMTIKLRIHGKNPRLGADGLAFWILNEPLRPGPVMGGHDKWRGIAVVMDSFDNSGDRAQPSIGIHHNDGSKVFEPGTDGQATLVQQCSAAFRNNDISYLHIYVENDQLFVYHDVEGRSEWTLCAGPIPFELPPRYFFGFSAATGGLSDAHDLLSLEVNTMDPVGMDYGLNPMEARKKMREEDRADRVQEELQQKAEQYLAGRTDVHQLPKPAALPRPTTSDPYDTLIDESDPVGTINRLRKELNNRDAALAKSEADVKQLEQQLQHAGDQFDQYEKEREETPECDSPPAPADAAAVATIDHSRDFKDLSKQLARIETSLSQYSLQMHEVMEKPADTLPAGSQTEDLKKVEEQYQSILKEISNLYKLMSSDNRADAIQHEETTRQMEVKLSEISTKILSIGDKLESMDSTSTRTLNTINYKLLTLSNTAQEQGSGIGIWLPLIIAQLLVIVVAFFVLGRQKQKAQANLW